jgi:hypothetical protein
LSIVSHTKLLQKKSKEEFQMGVNGEITRAAEEGLLRIDPGNRQ